VNIAAFSNTDVLEKLRFMESKSASFDVASDWVCNFTTTIHLKVYI